MPMCSMVGSKLSHIVSPYIASWLRIFPARLANLKLREVEPVLIQPFGSHGLAYGGDDLARE
jgi:hypothetical protein